MFDDNLGCALDYGRLVIRMYCPLSRSYSAKNSHSKNVYVALQHFIHAYMQFIILLLSSLFLVVLLSRASRNRTWENLHDSFQMLYSKIHACISIVICTLTRRTYEKFVKSSVIGSTSNWLILEGVIWTNNVVIVTAFKGSHLFQVILFVALDMNYKCGHEHYNIFVFI